MTAEREVRQVLRREGEYWTIHFDGQVVRLKDSKGLRYLALLLRHPGHKVAATELVASSGDLSKPRTASSPMDHPEAERARLTVTKGIKSALDRIAAVHPILGQHLQVTVRRGYACAYTPDPRHPISWDE